MSSHILSCQHHCKQLEDRLVELASRLSKSDEEKSRAESLVAQLEMESSSIGEYITLFAHRRQVATQRARIREGLLAKLVQDRKLLRQRLGGLVQIADQVVDCDTEKADAIANSSEFFFLLWNKLAL